MEIDMSNTLSLYRSNIANDNPCMAYIDQIEDTSQYYTLCRPWECMNCI